MRKLHFWSTLATSLVMFTATCQAATLPVTSDLLIRLDGTETSLTLVGNEVSNWNNQGTGGPASFDAPTVGNRPTRLTSQIMPNGSAHSTIEFDKAGSGTSLPVLNDTPFLTAGPSSAFDSLKTLTMFSVFKVASLAPEGNTVTQKEQVVFGSRHITTGTSTTAAWSHTFEDDSVTDVVGQPETIGNQPAIMPQFRQSGTLNETFTDADLNPAAVAADTWYVVASRWNGTGADVNGQPAYTTTSVVLTSGASPMSLEMVTKSTTAVGEFVSWSTHDGFTIGKNVTTGTAGGARRGFLDGQIAEILVYGDTLSEADFESMTGYLANKYLIPEPSSMWLAVAMGLLGITAYRRNAGRA